MTTERAVRPSRLNVVGVLASLLVAAAVAFAALRPFATKAGPANTMAVDAIAYQVDDDVDGLFDEDPGARIGEGIDADGDTTADEDDPTSTADSVDASRMVSGSTPFDVSVNVTWGGATEDRWHAYQLTLAYDDSILVFVPMLDSDLDSTLDSWAYTGLGGTTMDATVTEYDTDGDGKTDALCGASRRNLGTTDASGQALVARFRCVGSGTSPLHLAAQAEDSGCGSATMAMDGVPLPTNLVDASITCSMGTPTPTPTPAASVGGIAELPGPAGGAPDREAGIAAGETRRFAGRGAAVALGLVAGVGVAAAGAWYARRRSLW